MNFNTDIFVGQKLTYYCGSDRYPYEIFEINGDRLWIRELDATPADGFDYYSNQVYNYSSNPNGRMIELSKRKDGIYRPVGSKIRDPKYFYFGYANYYSDPSF